MRPRRPGRMIPFVVGIGLLAVVSGGPPTVPAAGLPAGPPVLAVAGTRLASDPCRESAYSHNGSRFTGTYRWWFSAGTVPPGLGKSAVGRALHHAVDGINGRRKERGFGGR